MTLLQSDSPMFSLVDIPACNPWWESAERLPAPGDPRADFGYRVKNTRNNRLLLIPGPPGTGKTRTVHELIRALVLGEDYENQSSLKGRAELPTDVDPSQICYVPCDDPLARFVDGFVAAAINRGLAERTEGTFFVFLDGIHRLPDWRAQLNSAVNGLAKDPPGDEWHIVATVPSRTLVDTDDFGTELDDQDDPVKLDLPHHVQKFRDSFLDADSLSEASELVHDKTMDRYAGDKNAIKAARAAFSEVSTGASDGSALVDALEDIRTAVLDAVEMDTVERRIDHYLLTGGFEPAVEGSTGDSNIPEGEAVTDSSSPAVERIHDHILSSLEATIYREIPQVVKVEDDLTRIEEPRDLNAVAAYLARRGYEETSYKDLAGEFDRDSRTVKQKYINMLADFHIISKSTRYELQRERSLRFFFRSPGYVSALLRSDPLETHRDDLVSTAIADHLHRQRTTLGANDTGVEYWRSEEAMVDFVLDADGGAGAIPFVSAFAERDSGPVESLSLFHEAMAADDDRSTSSLEVVVGDVDSSVELVERADGDIYRLWLPYWVLLLIG